MDYLPRISDADREDLRHHLLRDHEVVLAASAGRVVGFCAWSPGWLDHLYIRPDAQNQGIGRKLIELTKARHPGGARLWVFQRNVRAIRFYEREGFKLEKKTDGSRNMERVPDALYSWEPATTT